MSTDIKTQFSSALSKQVSGGAGTMAGAQNQGIDGTATLTSINGSPIVTFDTTSAEPIPQEDLFPSIGLVARGIPTRAGR